MPVRDRLDLHTGYLQVLAGAGEAPAPPLHSWGLPEAVAMEIRVAWSPAPQGHAFPLRWSLLIGRPSGSYHQPRAR